MPCWVIGNDIVSYPMLAMSSPEKRDPGKLALKYRRLTASMLGRYSSEESCETVVTVTVTCEATGRGFAHTKLKPDTWEKSGFRATGGTLVQRKERKWT